MRMHHVGADKILARPGDYINSMIKAAELNNNIPPLRQSNKVTHFINLAYAEGPQTQTCTKPFSNYQSVQS